MSSAARASARVELVALDLDGTLVDSAPDVAHSLGHALEAVGRDPPGEKRTRDWVGDGLETLIARALADADGSAAPADDATQRAALAAFLDCYRDHLFVRSRLYPRVPETLDALLGRGVRLCCITNKRHAFADRLLLAAGIRDRFELVLGGDSLAEKKPSPLPLRVAAATLRTAPAAAVLVGDSHQDLRAAHGAGIRFVYASYGYGKVDAAELGASARLDVFAVLPSTLGL